jgi:phosphate transport system substrate-binding protein
LKLQILMSVAASAIALSTLSPRPAQSYPICVCNKKDMANGNALPRCGDATEVIEGPGGRYDFTETGRGRVILFSDEYEACKKDECAKLATQPPSQTQVSDQTQVPSRTQLSAQTQSCEPTREAVQESVEKFSIYGSATIGARLIPHLIAEYAEDQNWQSSTDACNGEIRLAPQGKPSQTALIVDCHATGSDTGIPELAEGHADIAMVSRPIKPDEVTQMRMRGYPRITTALQEHVLALDGVSIIVSDHNPADGLTLEDIRTIFEDAGGVWKFYLLDYKSGTRAIFESMIFPGGQRLPSCESANVRCFANPEDVAKAVASDPRGIGFVSSAYKNVAGVKIVPIKGKCGITQEPSVFNIKTEDYLFSRQLLLYTAKVRSLQASGFVFYAMSEEAQPLIEKLDYVNQTIASQSAADAEKRITKYQQSPPKEPNLDYDRNAMADLHNTLKGAARLSISFRFRFNSTTLDTRAVQDLHRLADYMTFTAKDRKIVLAGFTDSAGNFQTNVDLGLNRAQAVAGALQAIGISADRITTKGAGELMPVACNDSALGQGKNRRVEAWLLP